MKITFSIYISKNKQLYIFKKINQINLKKYVQEQKVKVVLGQFRRNCVCLNGGDQVHYDLIKYYYTTQCATIKSLFINYIDNKT